MRGRSAAYGRAKSHNVLFVLIVFVGIGVSIAIGAAVPKSTGAWILVVLSLPILVAMAACAILLRSMNRKRVSGVREALEGWGFTVNTAPQTDEKQKFFAPLAHLESWAGLRYGADRIGWFAHRAADGVCAYVFEHEYITGSGKSTQGHPHTVIAWTSDLAAQGGLTLYRPHRLERRLTRNEAPELEIGDATFDRDWIVRGDAHIAQRALNAGARASLENSPRGESWQLGAGWVSCVCDRQLSAKSIQEFWEHVARTTALMHGAKS